MPKTFKSNETQRQELAKSLTAHGFRLTDAQVIDLLDRHLELDAGLAVNGGFDTGVREQAADLLTMDLLGAPYPRYGIGATPQQKLNYDRLIRDLALRCSQNGIDFGE